MAIRVQFFTIAGTGDFELVPPAALDAAVAAFDAGTAAAPGGDVRCVGWLSAGDHDEELFTDWCDEVDDALGVGLVHQGIGEDSGLEPAAAKAGGGAWEDAWTATLRAALEAAAGGRLGWRTDYDLAGTTGTPDDYPTSAHPLS
jgi:hypothetical protein